MVSVFCFIKKLISLEEGGHSARLIVLSEYFKNEAEALLRE